MKTNEILIHTTLLVMACVLLPTQAETTFTHFDVVDNAAPPSGIPEVQPWRSIALEPEYGGQWLVAGDVDGDGAVEIVSAENRNDGDIHFTSAVAVQDLDGKVLWTWGQPDLGRKNWHHDVACQIIDWDGDGKLEVVVCDAEAIVELDGATGTEKRRIPIQKEATDCLVFCDLSGVGRPTDVLVKNRYEHIWAYDRTGTILWDVQLPGGYRTAHQPRPMDLDGDGRDEVMAGFALLNHDGTLRWTFASSATDLNRGHLDCARVMTIGARPEDTRIAITCCGADNIAVVDGNGKARWEFPGHHFESAQVGAIIPGRPGPQILVDVDHRPEGEGPLWVFDADGTTLGRIVTRYGRHHRLLDWTGDGYAEILAGDNQAIYDHTGARVATLAIPGFPAGSKRDFELSILQGDCDGDGRQDILLVTLDQAYIYRNEQGARPEGGVPLGTELNFTLY